MNNALTIGIGVLMVCLNTALFFMCGSIAQGLFGSLREGSRSGRGSGGGTGGGSGSESGDSTGNVSGSGTGRSSAGAGTGSLAESLLFGLFIYYICFEAVCLPVMLAFRPLSVLSRLWTVFLCAAAFLCLWLNCVKSKRLFGQLKRAWDFVTAHPVFTAAAAVLVVFQLTVILKAYNFTLDAAYYVANVTTSVQTDTLNIYDPYTGNWQDHFEMRYFFATYPLNDAVMCSIFNIHPLLWTKGIMAATAILYTDLVWFMTARLLWEKDCFRIFTMLFFGVFMSFFYNSIYTPAEFMLKRTYEGKSLVGNIVVGAVIYLFMQFYKREEKRLYLLLLIVCAGSACLSSSANMLIPAQVFLMWTPLAIVRRRGGVLMKALFCTLPCVILMLVYVAYVRGMFVLHTY